MILQSKDVTYYCANCENGGVWEKGTKEPNCLDCGSTLYEYEDELESVEE